MKCYPNCYLTIRTERGLRGLLQIRFENQCKLALTASRSFRHSCQQYARLEAALLLRGRVCAG